LLLIDLLADIAILHKTSTWKLRHFHVGLRQGQPTIRAVRSAETR